MLKLFEFLRFYIEYHVWFFYFVLFLYLLIHLSLPNMALLALFIHSKWVRHSNLLNIKVILKPLWWNRVNPASTWNWGIILLFDHVFSILSDDLWCHWWSHLLGWRDCNFVYEATSAWVLVLSVYLSLSFAGALRRLTLSRWALLLGAALMLIWLDIKVACLHFKTEGFSILVLAHGVAVELQWWSWTPV